MQHHWRQAIAIVAKLGLFALSVVVLLQAAPGIVPERLAAAAGSPPTAVRPAPSVAAATAPTPRAPAATPRPAAPDQPATLSSVRVVRELNVPHWLGPGQFVWDAEGAPTTGQVIIVVNLRARVLSVYRAGVEIGRSSLIYGFDEKPTPIGTFPILEKDADHVSNLYDAPMPHMLRLTWDGVALHGSPELRDDLVTHGCVGLPREFAALLFDQVRVGDQVIVWDGERSA